MHARTLPCGCIRDVVGDAFEPPGMRFRCHVDRYGQRSNKYRMPDIRIPQWGDSEEDEFCWLEVGIGVTKRQRTCGCCGDGQGHMSHSAPGVCMR
jgi:hypothetical protein